MSNPILASWLNTKYTDLVALSIPTGVVKRTVTQGDNITATDTNNLINDINNLQSNKYLKHADGWNSYTPTAVGIGEVISEPLKSKIDNLIDEFKQMCGNQQTGYSNRVTTTGFVNETGFGRSNTTGNGQKIGEGVTTGGSWDCNSVNHIGGCHTCTNNYTNTDFSTFFNSTTRTSDSTTRFSTTSTRNSRTTVYNFAVKRNNGLVENSNTSK